MGEPTWRQIKKLKVPAEPGMAWTPAWDFVTTGKLYRISVAATQKWKPESSKQDCHADGDPTLTRSGEVLMSTAAVGALIGKIGGSTADFKPDPNKVTLFSAGRYCVFSIADSSKTGPLYLGINDTAGSQDKVDGQLEVLIEEGL